MNRMAIVAVILALAVADARSAQPDFVFGEINVEDRSPWISKRQLAQVKREVRSNTEKLMLDGAARRTPANTVIKLEWPVKAAAGFTDPGWYGISVFPDHDPQYPDHLLDFNCGSRTYDLDIGYNHAGTDIFNWPFLFNKMDNDEVEVAAAYDGTVVYIEDGNDDRSCGFGGGDANVVVLYHDNGAYTVYGHMKNGSLPAKIPGNTVVTGEYLGVVGSSGQSTGPHLHFEVWENDSTLLDPWDGPCNDRVTESWWAEQKPYYDPALNKISTHSAPVEWGTCPAPDVTHIKDVFIQGNTVYFYVFGRDGLLGDAYDFTIYRPDASVFGSWTYVLDAGEYFAAYYIGYGGQIPIDEQTGKWTYQVSLRGRTYEHDFYVGGVPVFFNAIDAVAVGGSVELMWDVFADEILDGFAVYRTEDGTSREIPVTDGLLAPQTRRYVDGGVTAGRTYAYVVAAVKQDGTEIRSAPVTVTLDSYSLSLVQNYPNPFNPLTTIEFTLPRSSDVELAVYDPRGRLVVTLTRGGRTEGVHHVTWDGRDAKGNPVGSGVYFYRLRRLRTGGRVLTKKMILLR